MTDDDLAYRKLIAALDGIARGKGPNDYVLLDGADSFEILTALHNASGLKGDFAGDHMDIVRAALSAWRAKYIGDDIIAVVAALLKKVAAT
ncbi:hypothetical protein V1281_004308 [Nitrobacteraceae bacterium AZCC 2161]